MARAAVDRCVWLLQRGFTTEATGDCRGAYLFIDSNGARRAQAFTSQETTRARAGGLWHSTEQEATADNIQEEG